MVAEWIDVLFFSFLIVLAWLRPLPWRQRGNATAIGAAGIGVIMAARVACDWLPSLAVSVVRDWLPAPLILVAYWQAGQFLRKPHEALQTTLQKLDERLVGALLHGQAGGRARRWVVTYLELAYLFCYPLIPCGLGVLYLVQLGRYADEFWMGVLPPTYLCYGMFPFIQTLPPWVLAGDGGDRVPLTRVRALNLWILRRASIQANTFPSAHVAASTAAAIVLLRLVPMAGLGFLGVSMSIAVGVVVCRYHYAADAGLGAVLAAAVVLLVSGCVM